MQSHLSTLVADGQEVVSKVVGGVEDIVAVDKRETDIFCLKRWG